MMGSDTMVDTMSDTPDSLLDQDDVAYPCKGCGEILEEGKAFELAGNRWHISCFQCNTCGTLLDSDANLLLLGDGSLICNNCTYSCNACGNKIEDLAILTGDQAFCANCFRCRNCKRKIENLRYARTSQGIFCMSCHESLMARRRKRSRGTTSATKTPSASQSPMFLDKSLPPPPPGVTPPPPPPPPPAVSTTSDRDRGTSPSDIYTETPTELSPRPPLQDVRQDSSRSLKRDRSGLAPDIKQRENMQLPATTYSGESRSNSSHHLEISVVGNRESQSFHIPLVLDTGIAPEIPERAPSREPSDPRLSRRKNPGIAESHQPEVDYFGGRPARSSSHQRPQEPSSKRHLGPGDHDERPPSSAEVSPHTSHHDRSRRSSSDKVAGQRTKGPMLPELDTSNVTTPNDTASSTGADDLRVQHASPRAPTQDGRIQSSHGDRFMLQEVPKHKKSGGGGSARSQKSDSQSPVDGRTPTMGTPASTSSRNPWPSSRNQSPHSLHLRPLEDSPRSSTDAKRSEELPLGPNPTVGRSRSAQQVSRPARQDSLRGTHPRKPLPKKDAQSRAITQSASSSAILTRERLRSGSTGATPGEPRGTLNPITNGNLESSRSVDSLPAAAAAVVDELGDPPLRARDHQHQHQKQQHASGPRHDETFTAPRAPPLLPTATQPVTPRHAAPPTSQQQQDTTFRDDEDHPIPQANGELNSEDDVARMLANTDESATSMLRRVSNAVRHGRSYSEAETRMKGGKWPRTPGRGMHSPTLVSPEMCEENEKLKSELRRSTQRVVELEARVTAGTDSDFATIDTKLREKRSTVAFLDTQKEMMVRELETLTEQLSDAKRSQQPLNFEVLRSRVVRDFALSLEQLKKKLAGEVEELIQEKNQLIEETANLTRLRDQAIQETEQLNTKNAQLADLNNELSQNINERNRLVRDLDRGGAAGGGAIDSPRLQGNGSAVFSYHPHQPHQHQQHQHGHKDRADSLPDAGKGFVSVTNLNGSTPFVETPEGDPPTVVTAPPHVVAIRKGQVVKKFNWKKPGQSVAKGVSKGIKGAFSSTSQNQPPSQYQRDGQMPESVPYGMTAVNEPPATVLSRSTSDMPRHGLGIFGTKPVRAGPTRMQSSGNLTGLSTPSATMITVEVPSTLFGSDLSERAEYERRNIPSVVTRCIEEVEIRGMDLEGIYRKTGGNSQVKTIQEGFERSDDYDISDPALDITAVTSVLKQYLRKLPIPLLTFDAYSGIMEAYANLDDENRALGMRATIDRLPTKHRDCLEFVVFHLARVATRAGENLMSPRNLAVVFAPTIMRDYNPDRDLQDMLTKNLAIQFLIEKNKVIFGNS